MRSWLLVVLATIILVMMVGGIAYYAARNAPAPPGAADNSPPKPEDAASPAPSGDPREVVVDPSLFEDGGLALAFEFTGSVRDPKSLAELRQSIEHRGELGLRVFEADLKALALGEKSSKEELAQAAALHRKIGLLHLYEGQFDKGAEDFRQAQDLARRAGAPPRFLDDLTAIRGIVALRQGEVSNCIACVGPSSCIFPIAPEAAHKQQEGSREAIKHFTEYLAAHPGDLRVRWLLNLAYMTLGEYPDKVPPAQLIPIEPFKSKVEVPAFANVALSSGINTRGPNLAGGSVFDDFTGDGLPDLFTTSLDANRGASFLVNKGDGTFADRSSSAGLDDQVYALNAVRADYDNDGHPDVLLLRGGWEKPMRLSLLRNTGKETFEDVTLAAGLGEPIATESAAWGDFDNDGFVDLFVCGEFLSPFGDSSPSDRDPRNRCRLYRNKGDGTFEDVAAKVGIDVAQCCKGCAWGDYDDDGDLDLFVSVMFRPCRLYRNDGKGHFEDVAPQVGLTGPDRGFACWWWDYDNDGRLDLFVQDYVVSLAQTAAQALGLKIDSSSRARLYRNMGPEGFRDVSAEVGLDRATAPMGCNFGDIDNDGYLDFYLGTGGMSYEYLVPNLLFKNMGGKSFEDVTMSSRTGHLQKGHGISFADYDNDGDLDLFVEAGGAVPGDSAFNMLFRNPGNASHWLRVKLIGTKTNRAALGAKIRATIREADGTTRTIHRTVGNNGSFGGNPLAEHLGLGGSDRVAELEVRWPVSGSTQTFKDLPADGIVEITEGTDQPKRVK